MKKESVLYKVPSTIIREEFNYLINPLHPDVKKLTIGSAQKFTMISVGHSIINRTSNVNVGSLTLQYGGGGHYQVGTCQANCEQADKIVNEMLQVVNGK